jgi:sulfur-oxidizing protein SoxY
MSISMIDRREFLLGAAGAATTLVAATALAQDAGQGWEDALKRIVGETKPIEGRIALDMPEIAENGNTVPFSISVDSPMTEKEYVKAIHVISTGNRSLAWQPSGSHRCQAGPRVERMRLARSPGCRRAGGLTMAGS